MIPLPSTYVTDRIDYLPPHFHRVFVCLRVNETHIPMSREWRPVPLPLFLRARPIIVLSSCRGSAIGETEHARSLRERAAFSHSVLQERVVTIVVPVRVPHPDEFDHTSKRHKTHDLIDFDALSIFLLQLDFEILRGLGDFLPPRAVPTLRRCCALRCHGCVLPFVGPPTNRRTKRTHHATRFSTNANTTH